MSRWKRKLYNFLLKHIFNAITEDEILRYRGGVFFHRGQPLTTRDSNSIISSGKTLNELLYWRLLRDEMKYLANKKMYQDSTRDEDMIFGKAMLFCVDIMERKTEKIANMDKTPVSNEREEKVSGS